MRSSDTTAAALAERLRAEIDAGFWQPGAVLRQEELAVRYGASRIPVREALQLLRAEGLVTIAANRGASVVSLSADDVAEIFDLRVLLEGHLLAAAIPHHNLKTLVRLEAIQQELEVEDSRTSWLLGDRRFHTVLYEPAARALTLDFVLKLRGQVERYLLLQIGPRARRAEWKREHRALIAAVRARNVRRALAALGDHLNETRALVLRRIRTLASEQDQERPV